MLTDPTRTALNRVIAVMNAKGGVGKTSITANVAGVMAEAGYRVLVVDLDPQGNLGRDLGYRKTKADDQGTALFNALAMEGALNPVKDVRTGLDVVPGGPRTSMLADALTGMSRRADVAVVNELLAERIAAIASSYDIILLDTPPGDAVMQGQALVAAKWLLIPTQPDDGSLEGLEQLANRVVDNRATNPTLAALGVVLFDLDTSATKVQKRAREKLAAIMGDAAPVFTAMVRHAKAAAVDARERGQLVIELAKDAEGEDHGAWKTVLRERRRQENERRRREAAGEQVEPDEEIQMPRQIAASAGSLAGDYLQLTREILQALGDNEKALVDAETAVASEALQS